MASPCEQRPRDQGFGYFFFDRPLSKVTDQVRLGSLFRPRSSRWLSFANAVRRDGRHLYLLTNGQLHLAQ